MPYEQIKLDWDDQALYHVSLNDTLEFAISKILREDPAISKQVLRWKRSMAMTIPGYNTYDDVKAYIKKNLASKSLDCEFDTNNNVGDEKDFINILTKLASEKAEEYDFERKEELIDLELIRKRKDIIGGFRTTDASLGKDSDKKSPSNDDDIDDDNNSGGSPFKPEFIYKLYYTYKLWEVLEAAVGYYNGSLEFRAGLTESFEYWSYLIQLKLRHPYRNYPFKAPKSMMEYKTFKDSILPYNNQFSFSLGFEEMSFNQMPESVRLHFQAYLLTTIFDDTQWKKLLRVLNWGFGLHDKLPKLREKLREKFQSTKELEKLVAQIKKSNKGYLGLAKPVIEVTDEVYHDNDEHAEKYLLTLENILQTLGDNEIAVKALFTLAMQIPWSDESLAKEHNSFAKALEKLIRDNDDEERHHINSLLLQTAIKDARVKAIDADTPLQRLAQAKRVYNCIGRYANILVTPKTAIPVLEKKLKALTKDQLFAVYGNIVNQQKLNKDFSTADITQQAQQAAERWLNNAQKNRKPIYTGPSGHALTYTKIYLSSLERQNLNMGTPASLDDKNPKGAYKSIDIIDGLLDYTSEYLDSFKQIKQKNLNPNDLSILPDLNRCKLVILASIMGANQHHSYDEGMTSLHGIEFVNPNGKAFKLSYSDPQGYQDVMNLPQDLELISKKFRKAAYDIAKQELNNMKVYNQTFKEDKTLDKRFQGVLIKALNESDVEKKQDNDDDEDDNIKLINQNIKGMKNWYNEKIIYAWYQTATGEKFDMNDKRYNDKKH